MTADNVRDRELVELLQELVRIPSWVDESEDGEEFNENKLVDFLEQWIRENTDMEVFRQELPGGRFNLIARRGEPHLVYLAHTDTVHPSVGAPYNQLAAEIHDGKVWGLGATDMKSGIATMLHALKLAGNVPNVWLILYADEEYDFLGMKGLIKEFSSIRPKLIVSSDGSDLKFGFGCRGCIEFRMRVIGETGHAARKGGKSAIWAAMVGLFELRKKLDQYEHPKMGAVTMNVSGFIGGTELPDGKSFSSEGLLVSVGMQGNKIPDITEFVLDIRPPTDSLDLEKVVSMLEDSFDAQEVGYKIVRRAHNLAFWYTNPDQLQRYVAIARDLLQTEEVAFDDPGNIGYLDLQMLWDATGRPPSLMFGGGVGDTAHGPNEHIAIKDLITTRDFFLKLLEDYRNS